ncbi:MAG: hypothetical protein ACFFAJ_15030 [Candidatus Hodarchaeota archaeon]
MNHRKTILGILFLLSSLVWVIEPVSAVEEELFSGSYEIAPLDRLIFPYQNGEVWINVSVPSGEFVRVYFTNSTVQPEIRFNCLDSNGNEFDRGSNFVIRTILITNTTSIDDTWFIVIENEFDTPVEIYIRIFRRVNPSSIPTTSTSENLFVNFPELTTLLEFGAIIASLVLIVGISTIAVRRFRSKSKTKTRQELRSSSHPFANQLMELFKRTNIKIYDLRLHNISKKAVKQINLNLKKSHISRILTLNGSLVVNKELVCDRLESNEVGRAIFSILSLDIPLVGGDISSVLARYKYKRSENHLEIKDFSRFENNEIIMKTTQILPKIRASNIISSYSDFVENVGELIINEKVKPKEYLEDHVLKEWEYHILIVQRQKAESFNGKIVKLEMMKGGLIFHVQAEGQIKKKTSRKSTSYEIKFTKSNEPIRIVTFGTVKIKKVPLPKISFDKKRISSHNDILNGDFQISRLSNKGEDLKKECIQLMNHPEYRSPKVVICPNCNSHEPFGNLFCQRCGGKIT